MRPHTVLLDLDGTLVDSAPGILGSLHDAFDELGLPWSEAAFDRRLVGPPMYETLPPLVGARAAEAVIPVYRRIYAERGLYLTTPYPGVGQLLAALATPASGSGWRPARSSRRPARSWPTTGGTRVQ